MAIDSEGKKMGIHLKWWTSVVWLLPGYQQGNNWAVGKENLIKVCVSY